MDKVNFAAWVDRTETIAGIVSEQMAQQIHATLGQAGSDAPQLGQPMPPLWHWYGFPPTAQMRELGRDGHPKLGGFLPPVNLDRRMWAGGKLTFHAPLHVGEALTKTSRIAAIEEKTGAAGQMVFVTLEHEISGAEGVAVSETQNIVYLAIPDQFRAPKPVAPPQTLDVEEVVDVSEVLLFRYSAITFNAHRIHYDLNYTQQVEHYPGLVVHGPMQANMLMDLAHRHAGRAPDVFAFRGIHPMFCPGPMRLCAIHDGAHDLKLCTATQAHQGLQATATWKESIQ